MSIGSTVRHDRITENSLDPKSLTAGLSSLRFDDGLSSLHIHGSSSSGSSSPHGAGNTGDERKLPPDTPRDPERMLTRFIEHLINSDHSDANPYLLTIGYELEALVSIYSSSAVRLSATSRPPSWNPDVAPPANLNLPPPLPTDTSAVPTSVSMTDTPIKRNSQAWDDAVADYEFGLSPTERIRYEVSIPVWESGETLEGVEAGLMPEDAPIMRILVSLPPNYPETSPPQLQLLGRYLGYFPIDTGLFGDITRTYITSAGVPFNPGDVCVFEGLTYVQSLVQKWYAKNLSEGIEGEKAREEDRRRGKNGRGAADLGLIDTDDVPSSLSTDHYPSRPSPLKSTFSYSRPSGSSSHQNHHVDGDGGAETPLAVHNAELNLPSGLKIHHSEPIVDRRSTFIGHAIRVTDEREVPLVIHELLGDRKIAKAAHPAIFAFRIARHVGGPAGTVYNTDYDDDGESQAGARLKHLIEILELENVLVVVSRWFGGIHLGPDRFKHINQAARDALEVGGFLDDGKDEKPAAGGGKGKGHKKK